MPSNWHISAVFISVCVHSVQCILLPNKWANEGKKLMAFIRVPVTLLLFHIVAYMKWEGDGIIGIGLKKLFCRESFEIIILKMNVFCKSKLADFHFSPSSFNGNRGHFRKSYSSASKLFFWLFSSLSFHLFLVIFFFVVVTGCSLCILDEIRNAIALGVSNHADIDDDIIIIINRALQ